MQMRTRPPVLVFSVLARLMREQGVSNKDPFYCAVHNYYSNPGPRTAAALVAQMDNQEEPEVYGCYEGEGSSPLARVAGQFAPYIKVTIDQIIAEQGDVPATDPQYMDPSFYTYWDLRLYCDMKLRPLVEFCLDAA